MNNRKNYYVKEITEWNTIKYAVTNGTENYPLSYRTLEEAEKVRDEWNSTYYVSDYDDKEIEDFYNTIPFDEVFKAINQYLGLNLTFTLEPRYQRNIEKPDRKRIDGFHFESNENLADMFPIIAKGWSEFKVSVFSNGISVDKKTGQLQAWATIDFSYEHLNGGSNGAEIMNFFYDGKTIQFRNQREVYEERQRRDEELRLKYGA